MSLYLFDAKRPSRRLIYDRADSKNLCSIARVVGAKKETNEWGIPRKLLCIFCESADMSSYPESSVWRKSINFDFLGP